MRKSDIVKLCIQRGPWTTVRNIHLIIVIANTGYSLQLQLGVQRAGMNVTVMHIVDLLDHVYGN